MDVAENRDKSNHRERYSEGRFFRGDEKPFVFVWTTFYFGGGGLEGGITEVGDFCNRRSVDFGLVASR